jgi:hypothetical protein
MSGGGTQSRDVESPAHNGLTGEVVPAKGRFIMRKPVVAAKKVRHKGLKDLVEIGLVEIVDEPAGASKTVRLLF